MVIRKNIDVTKKTTPEQAAMLVRAMASEIPDDAEYPELTKEELRQFKRVSEQKKCCLQNKEE